jgi:hypothetical protein
MGIDGPAQSDNNQLEASIDLAQGRVIRTACNTHGRPRAPTATMIMNYRANHKKTVWKSKKSNSRRPATSPLTCKCGGRTGAGPTITRSLRSRCEPTWNDTDPVAQQGLASHKSLFSPCPTHYARKALVFPLTRGILLFATTVIQAHSNMEGLSNLTISACSNVDADMHLNDHFHYKVLANQFSQFHKTPVNVALHLLTSPLGLLGFLCLLKRITNSTSLLAVFMLVYLVSLMSSATIGSFVGSALLCGILLGLTRKIKLNMAFSLVCIAVAYGLQDLAHYLTGEATFQASYTKGSGQVCFLFDIGACFAYSSDCLQMDMTMEWASKFFEHTYYLLPLCVEVALPWIPGSRSFQQLLASPLPVPLQYWTSQIWIIVPLILVVYGSYCLDSKNRFCVFPGFPTFQRVLACDLYEGDNKAGHQSDIRLIRNWVMEKCPSDVTSTHYWFWSLPEDIKAGFDRCANAPGMFSMFRSLFSEQHYCVDVVEGMNEIYVTGPERFDEGPNSDQIFDMRHVDGPWGVVPFVSVYRCLIGMDRNHVVRCAFCPQNRSLF